MFKADKLKKKKSRWASFKSQLTPNNISTPSVLIFGAIIITALSYFLSIHKPVSSQPWVSSVVIGSLIAIFRGYFLSYAAISSQIKKKRVLALSITVALYVGQLMAIFYAILSLTDVVFIKKSIFALLVAVSLYLIELVVSHKQKLIKSSIIVAFVYLLSYLLVDMTLINTNTDLWDATVNIFTDNKFWNFLGIVIIAIESILFIGSIKLFTKSVNE